MREKYQEPELILTEYQTEDVITSSAENDNDHDASIWG